MADTGWLNATAATNVGSGESWTDPEAVYTSNDDYALSDIFPENSAKILRVTGFNPQLPANAADIRLEVLIEKRGEVADKLLDSMVSYYNGSSEIGDNKASPTPWPTSDLVTYYGGPEDDWNAVITAAQANSIASGIQIQVFNEGKSFRRQARIDHVSLRYFYNVIHLVTSSSAGVSSAAGTICVSQRTEGGAGGAGSVSAHGKAARRSEGWVNGSTTAEIRVKVARCVAGSASGAGDAFVSAGDKVGYRVTGTACGTSAVVVAARQRKRAYGFGYGGSSAAIVVLDVTKITGGAAGFGMAGTAVWQRVHPFVGMDTTARTAASEVLAILKSRGWEYLDDTPYLADLVRAIIEVTTLATVPQIVTGSTTVEFIAQSYATVKVTHNLGKANVPVSLVIGNQTAPITVGLYGISSWDDNSFTAVYYSGSAYTGLINYALAI